MNSQDAYKILGLQNGADEKEIKSAFRKLAAKHHPDKNKDNAASEEEFKKINSAYQFLTNPQKSHQNNQSSDFHDFINTHFNGGMPFGNRNSSLFPVQLPITPISITLNFSESVLGCAKDVVMDSHFHCQDCQGCGSVKLTDDCKNCNGQGSKQAGFSRGNMVFVQSCPTCSGTGKTLKKCDVCSGQGYSTKNGTVNLTIPAGVANGNVLRSNSVILQISVTPDPDMTLQDGNVLSTIELTLLEALKGMKKVVRTVKGDMTLKIPPKVKNKDNIMVQGYGVPSVNGSHIFDVRVSYPENSDKLIEILENDINK